MCVIYCSLLLLSFFYSPILSLIFSSTSRERRAGRAATTCGNFPLWFSCVGFFFVLGTLMRALYFILFLSRSRPFARFFLFFSLIDHKYPLFAFLVLVRLFVCSILFCLHFDFFSSPPTLLLPTVLSLSVVLFVCFVLCLVVGVTIPFSGMAQFRATDSGN